MRNGESLCFLLAFIICVCWHSSSVLASETWEMEKSSVFCWHSSSVLASETWEMESET
jgi:hypothetical protein